MSITRQQAEDRYGSASALAHVLGISPQTVSGWDMDKAIPPTHQKTLAGWIDRDYWADTYRQIADYFPPYAGPSDRRVRRTFIDADVA
jgi:DNA-binding transcriptional regulator YdaS (Cro superfamily)